MTMLEFESRFTIHNEICVFVVFKNKENEENHLHFLRFQSHFDVVGDFVQGCEQRNMKIIEFQADPKGFGD
jgi:hypothetical protein